MGSCSGWENSRKIENRLGQTHRSRHLHLTLSSVSTECTAECGRRWLRAPTFQNGIVSLARSFHLSSFALQTRTCGSTWICTNLRCGISMSSLTERTIAAISTEALMVPMLHNRCMMALPRKKKTLRATRGRYIYSTTQYPFYTLHATHGQRIGYKATIRQNCEYHH